MTPPELRQLATSIRRQTNNRLIIDLCDGVLALRIEGAKVPKPKQSRALYFREWRARRKLAASVAVRDNS